MKQCRDFNLKLQAWDVDTTEKRSADQETGPLGFGTFCEI